MSNRDPFVYVRHMLDHEQETGKIVGKPRNGIPKKFRYDHLDIPWRGISGVRMKLAHAYDSIDFDIPRDIVHNDPPTPVEQLNVLVGEKSD